MMFLMLSPEEAVELREKWPDMSEEERNEYRTKMRAKWDSLSDEEKEKLRTKMRERYGRSIVFDSQLNAIRAIEAQLGRLKSNFSGMQPESGRSYRDLSEEERTKVAEQFAKTRRERQDAFQEILAQLVRLQGQRPPRSSTESAEYIIVNISDLKPIQDYAEKEKATETAARLERLISIASREISYGGGMTRMDSPIFQDRMRPPRPERGDTEDSENSEQ
jgi:hypothetical protein